MRKMRIKRVISTILIVLLVVTCGGVTADNGIGIMVYGDTTTDINNAKDKKDEISSKLEDTKKDLEELQQQSEDTRAYIQKLDGKMTALDNSLYELNGKIEDMQLQIEDAEVKLEEAEIDADLQYEAMKLRIKFMYERSDDSYLEILLSSSSLADMLNKADYIAKISQYDREKLAEYQQTIQYIAQTKQELERDYLELDEMKLSLEEQKESLAYVQKEKEKELAVLKQQTDKAAETKAQLEKELEQQENEILNLVAKKAAEEEAARREQEANNSNNGNGSSNGSSGGVSESGFIWPTISKRITSRFGDTENRTSPHRGLDIGAVKPGVSGDPIYAAASGTVVISTYSASAGNYITINHGNGMSTVYMHCTVLKVSVGQQVTQGQTIGLMGTTGNSTGVHLHFAVIKGGQYVNPLLYLP
ncbi:MAG: peptidoglycan DD-metalloendopeptidase family protein [Lachnospira sp.]|nr:peptidoglycan DD-metalloendopeptidase family protein [Lachnospira sp.]